MPPIALSGPTNELLNMKSWFSFNVCGSRRGSSTAEMELPFVLVLFLLFFLVGSKSPSESLPSSSVTQIHRCSSI